LQGRPEDLAPAYPRALGRYTLLARLGRGGMATVHLAEEQGSTSLVAVKVPHRHLVEDEGSLGALEDEARVVAHIDHPYVVPLRAVERTREGPLLVMPYIPGLAVIDVMRSVRRQRRLVPVAVAARITLDAALGLDAAHAVCDARGRPLGVVHRDVSPHNLLLGEDGVTRVLDFGIAKASDRLQKSTTSGVLKGKISYMAPEQLHGEPVSAATDVYALGVVLWELLTGKRLFAGDNEADSMRRALTEVVPAPSSERPDLPARLDDVVLRAVCRELPRRTPSANELASALSEVASSCSHADVAAWLHDVCAEEVRARTAMVIAVRPRAAVTAEPALDANETETARPRDEAPRRSRWYALGVLGVALGVAGLAAFTWTASAGSTDGAPSGSGAALISTASASVNNAQPPGVPTATPSSSGPTSPSAGTASDGSVSPPASTRRVAPARRPRPALRPDCAVPYTVDDHGRKKFRPECFD
jgi:eukaryotic-like serine/threonine-protein kinase